mgnify:CR=1 FL=1
MKNFDYQDVLWWDVAHNNSGSLLVLGLLILGVAAMLLVNRK